MSEASLNERLVRLETEMKEVRSTVQAIHDISTNIALMNQSLLTLTNNFCELKADVEEVKEKPSRDATLIKTVIITAILTTVASSFTTLILTRIITHI